MRTYGRKISKNSSNKSKAKNLTSDLSKTKRFASGRKLSSINAPPLVQTKMKISQPGDRYEQEADLVAERVVNLSESKNLKEQDYNILKIETSTESSSEISSGLAKKVIEQKGTGKPLSKSVRDYFESRFGYDLSQVRIHNDKAATVTTRRLNADAFVSGKDVFFADDQYQMQSIAGRLLLAHELVHVIQQSNRSSLTSAEKKSHNICDSSHRQTNDNKHTTNSTLHSLELSDGMIIQRYTVPRNLQCDEVVGWFNDNSPYSPEWAQTNCNYSFNGNLSVNSTTLADGRVQINARGHNGLTVSVNCPIDMPNWSPSSRPNRKAIVAAWNRARGTLLTHEQRHQQIGEQWRQIFQRRFRNINITVTGSNRQEAMALAQAQVASLQAQWQAEAQAAQDAIDPFTGATLTCP